MIFSVKFHDFTEWFSPGSYAGSGGGSGGVNYVGSGGSGGVSYGGSASGSGGF
jgi:hypothetical protein